LPDSGIASGSETARKPAAPRNDMLCQVDLLRLDLNLFFIAAAGGRRLTGWYVLGAGPFGLKL
jgi:hypothetical protein